MTDNEIIKVLEGCKCDTLELALDLINRQKAEIERLNAMVAPVKHGKWELCFEDSRRQIEGNKCSVCGYEYYGNKYFYCPNCGARMDGDTT